MVAIVETSNETAQVALQAFLKNVEGIKVKWFDDESDIETAEDEMLYQLMMEEPKEYLPIEIVKQKLQDKINASNRK